MRVSRGPGEGYVRSRVPRGFHLEIARRIQSTLLVGSLRRTW
ncbi:hypothetical protein [Vulcanisaeta sp. JCM 14467]|nr:hypothetical protein [Vulcanisaeta sp. JCM 14467]